MTEERKLETIVGGFFDAEGHAYYDVDMKRVPGVTSVLSRVGMVCYDGIAEYILRRKAAIGTAAHAASHYYDEGDLDEGTIDPAVKPYLLAWKRFRTQSDFKPELLEFRMVGKAFGLAVGGTSDRTGTLYGKNVLVEIKCTACIEPSWGPQTAGYETLHRLLPDGVRRDRLVVWLRPNGTYQFVPMSDTLDYRMFRLALEMYYKRRDGRAAIDAWLESKGGFHGNRAGDARRIEA